METQNLSTFPSKTREKSDFVTPLDLHPLPITPCPYPLNIYACAVSFLYCLYSSVIVVHPVKQVGRDPITFSDNVYQKCEATLKRILEIPKINSYLLDILMFSDLIEDFVFSCDFFCVFHFQNIFVRNNFSLEITKQEYNVKNIVVRLIPMETKPSFQIACLIQSSQFDV